MATIFRCDRCKEIFERSDDIRPIEFERPDRNEYSFANVCGGDQQTKELCVKCYRKIWDVLKTPPKEDLQR